MNSRHLQLVSASLALALGVLHVGDAAAQRVVLVRPPASSPTLDEAFNRLRGELGLHGFEVEIREGEELSSSTELAAVAESEAAVASVAFVETAGQAAVEIRISDRVTGKSTQRTIATAGSNDAAALLALRALELLRASLREYSPEAPPPPDVVDAAPERADEVVTAFAEVPEPRWWFGGGPVVVLSLPEPSVAVGPELELGFTVSRWGARLVLAGPTLGATYDDGLAEARFRLGLGLLEGGYDLAAGERWSVVLAPSLGAAYLTVDGSARAPWSGRKDSQWVLAVGGNLDASVRVVAATRLALTARALALAPTPIIEVADARPRAGAPLLTTTVAFRVGF